MISKQIQEIDRKLAEHYVVHDQFEALRSQYQTDVERMAFIVEGELITKGIQGTGGINDTVARDTGDTGDTRDFDRTPNITVTGDLINRPFEAYNNAAAANNFMACNNLITHVPLTCPFCGGKYIPHDEPSYIESVRANLSRIKKHMSELNVADNDVLEQIENLKKEKERLEQHLIKSEFFESDREAVSMLINLNACSTRLRGMGSKTQIEKERNRYRQDLLNYQRQKDKIQKTYYIREKFPAEIILELEDLIISLLREFKCPHSNSAHYNIETWDIEFGSVNKTGIMGGGYSGIVNIAHALALKKLLSEHRSPTLNMLMIDSPLTSLSETDGIDDNKSIRTAFMKYLIEHRRDGQVIIFEHKDRMPAFIEKLCPNFQDYQDEFFSIIQFSHNLRHGRPGLFPGVADDGR